MPGDAVLIVSQEHAAAAQTPSVNSHTSTLRSATTQNIVLLCTFYGRLQHTALFTIKRQLAADDIIMSRSSNSLVLTLWSCQFVQHTAQYLAEEEADRCCWPRRGWPPTGSARRQPQLWRWQGPPAYCWHCLALHRLNWRAANRQGSKYDVPSID